MELHGPRSREGRRARAGLAASSAAYGDTPTLPKSEDMRPSDVAVRAVTKLTCEHYLRVFAFYGIETPSLATSMSSVPVSSSRDPTPQRSRGSCTRR
jgi:hypothetical protein